MTTVPFGPLKVIHVDRRNINANTQRSAGTPVLPVFFIRVAGEDAPRSARRVIVRGGVFEYAPDTDLTPDGARAVFQTHHIVEYEE